MTYRIEVVTPAHITVAELAPTGQALRTVAMPWDTLREAARHEEPQPRAIYTRLLAQARGLAERRGLGWRGSRKTADRLRIEDAIRHYILGCRREAVWVDPDHAHAFFLDREAPQCATHLETGVDEGETL